MSCYAQERRVFDFLKNNCSKAAKGEYELAVNMLLQYYNTAIYENRFIVGGAVEVFTCAILRAVGISCTLYADQSNKGDILLENDRKLSIKGTFTGGPANVKLMNKLGEGERQWDTATLFVISEVGIVYGSPDMVNPEHIKDVKDGLELKKAALVELIRDDSNVFKLEINRKPDTLMTGLSQKASTTVAKQIMKDLCLVALPRAFQPNEIRN